jgi:hypothetical protein
MLTALGIVLRLEVRDALAEDGDEVAHDVGDGMLYPEEVGVEIPLRDLETELSGHADVELILRDRLEHGPVLVHRRILGIVGDARRLDRDADLVNLLPGHLHIGTTGSDDPHLGIGVAGFVLVAEVLRDGEIEGRFALQPLRPTEGGDDGPLVLLDGVETGEDAADDEPSDGAEEDSDEKAHTVLSVDTTAGKSQVKSVAR